MTRFVRLPWLFSVLFILVSVSSAEEDVRPAPRGPEEKPVKQTVAILLFEGVELLDFAGPAEVFIVANHGKSFRCFTVAGSTNPIKTMGGITVKPDFSFGDAPKADVLIVPGGNTRSVGKAGVEWLRRAAGDARIVMSVCYGAFLLAEAGLLDGTRATTHHWGIDDLKRAAPKCRVVAGVRYVDDGKIVTTAGVTAGLDGSLHVVGRLLGEKAARWTAEEWMEYRWRRPSWETQERDNPDVRHPPEG